MVVVYTDGACLDNGQQNARAESGVLWGDNDKRNVSELVSKDLPQTNGYVELGSVIKTIEMAVNCQIRQYICCKWWYKVDIWMG